MIRWREKHMYICRIFDCNIGPIGKLNIIPSFGAEGNPKPLIFVGENGSGKSTIISNIVDSFYEMAGIKYGNARHSIGVGNKYEYYKNISGIQIKFNEKYMFSLIEYDNNADYVLKSGDCSFETFKQLSNYKGNISNWDKKDNLKQIQGINDKDIEKLFSEEIFCFFGPERYEKPNWLGDSYYDDLSTHLNVHPKVIDRLYNPITACNMGKDNLRWLLDVIVDSRTDIDVDEDGSLKSVHVNMDSLLSMLQAKSNVEKVMSSILGEDVFFGLNLRKVGAARFSIRKKSDNSVISPSLDSLSTGQLALFNVFSSIIRYADNIDINKSIHLDQIKGIVVIDEIELHLHSIHQKEILPRLMKLFPKVQFIITTHSPLFLLGLNSEYGEDGFDIYQMPKGNKIVPESFSEFERAYTYFTETNLHHELIASAIDSVSSDKPLIITEGATDWKHMFAAYRILSQNESYKDIFEGLSFDFFKYEPANSDKNAEYKIDMGNEALTSMCVAYSKLPQRRKMIFIADCDVQKTNAIMTTLGQSYKKWGNNVYSFILPVPENRKNTPNICIEHLYSDDEIRTEKTENGISRRLYLGYEFDSKGFSKKLNKYCEKRNVCGPNMISIIDGTSGERVIEVFSEDEVNYALSKMEFAECVLNKLPGFDEFDFSNFVRIFEIIRDIVIDDCDSDN